MIAQASVQEVLNRSDIVEIIGQFVRLKKRGTNYIANCPFHNEKSPSFSVSATRGIYKCFGCGRGGNVVTFIQEHEKLTFVESIRWLADFYKIALQETERTPEQVQHQLIEESLRILNEFATTFFQETLKTDEGQAIGLSYFKQRGLRPDTLEKFRLGYCPEDGHSFHSAATSKGYKADILSKAGLAKERNGLLYDSYRGRVIFPIQGNTGRILGFGARILKSNEKAPKYINTPENELYFKSKVLYGLYQARQSIGKNNECFLVEGYLDVISLSQAGIENVVASSGTSLTEDQLRSIGQLTKNLTILYDGDAAGVKAALRGMDMALSQSFNVQLALLPEGEDPDSFVQKHGKTGFEAYIKEHKQDVIGFRLEVGMKEVGGDPVKKSKLVNEVAESISRINKAEDFALQEHYIRESSRKLQVDESGLINLVNKHIRERLEQEGRQHQQRRQQEEQEQIPDVPVGNDPEEMLLPQKDPLAQYQELQEWQLLRVLLEHGDQVYKEFGKVADLIFDRIDPDLIATPLARKIYDEYYTYIALHRKSPSIQYFVTHPDSIIQQKIAALLHERDQMSVKWKENYDIDTVHGEDNYINDADSTLSYFEVKKLKVMRAELLKQFDADKSPERDIALIKLSMELAKQEKEILKLHGSVVLRMGKL